MSNPSSFHVLVIELEGVFPLRVRPLFFISRIIIFNFPQPLLLSLRLSSHKTSKFNMENKMTIHRALAELKLIDAKIEKQTVELHPTSAVQKGKKINGHLSEEEFKSQVSSRYDSIVDLIDRKVNIKSAIVESNGKTRVEIAGKSYTVADAITFKTVVLAKKNFIANMKQKSSHIIGQLNKNNETINKNVDALLANAFGKENIKASKEDVDNISKPYLEYNIFNLVDPLKIDEKIEKMEKEVQDFEVNVDAILSESNAITVIAI